MVEYRDSVEGLTEHDFEGFCIGWSKPLSGEKLLNVLSRSHHALVALADGQVVGYVNAISEGVLMAFVPLLEVRPDFQGQGIGTELMKRIIGRYRDLYGVDLLCDRQLVPFYERLGMREVAGMCIRNPSNLP